MMASCWAKKLTPATNRVDCNNPFDFATEFQFDGGDWLQPTIAGDWLDCCR